MDEMVDDLMYGGMGWCEREGDAVTEDDEDLIRQVVYYEVSDSEDDTVEPDTAKPELFEPDFVSDAELLSVELQ